MATLEQINGYHLRFHFGGKAFRRSWGTTNDDDCEAIKKQAEVHLHHINVGLIDQPPQNAEVIQSILSGGKSVAK